MQDHGAKHLHICSFLAALEMPDAAHVAHAAGMTVSMDPGWDEAALRDPRLRVMIDALDIFMPSQSELCYIAEDNDPHQAARALLPSGRNSLLVVKQGARPSIRVPERPNRCGSRRSRSHLWTRPGRATPLTPVSCTATFPRSHWKPVCAKA